MHPHCFKSNKGGRSSCHPSSSPHCLLAPNSLAPMSSAAAVLAVGGGCLCLDPLNPQWGPQVLCFPSCPLASSIS